MANADDAVSMEDLLEQMARNPPAGFKPVPLETIPLFMPRLPENSEGNIALDALDSLLQEGTLDDRASNFKMQGNESYRLGGEGHLTDAVMFYTRGLELNPPDVVLKSNLLLNRCAAYLSLGRNRLARQDALSCLQKCPETMDPSWKIKAHVRLVRASLLSDEISGARDAFDRLMAMVGSNAALAEESEKSPVLNELRGDLEAAESRLARIQRERDGMEMVLKGLLVEYVEGAEDALLIDLGGDERYRELRVSRSVNAGMREWPVVLLYPCEAQSDVVPQVLENARIRDVLALVCSQPAPWQTQHYTRIESLRIYRIGEDQKLIQIPQDASLLSVIQKSVTRVHRGLLAFYVLPSANTPSAVEFLSRFPPASMLS